MYCSNCGAEIDGAFCAKCGAPAGGGDVGLPPRAGAVKRGMETGAARPSSSRKVIKIILAVSIAIAVLIGGLMAYGFYSIRKMGLGMETRQAETLRY